MQYDQDVLQVPDYERKMQQHLDHEHTAHQEDVIKTRHQVHTHVLNPSNINNSAFSSNPDDRNIVAGTPSFSTYSQQPQSVPTSSNSDSTYHATLAPEPLSQTNVVSAIMNTVTDEVLLGLNPKLARRQAHFEEARPSKFCHICSRVPKGSNSAVCSMVHEGVCRKVICRRCFTEYKLGNFRDVRNGTESNWKCTHCLNRCPVSAQCKTYQKVNDKNRLRKLKIQKERAISKLRSIRTSSGNGDCPTGLADLSLSNGNSSNNSGSNIAAARGSRNLTLGNILDMVLVQSTSYDNEQCVDSCVHTKVNNASYNHNSVISNNNNEENYGGSSGAINEHNENPERRNIIVHQLNDCHLTSNNQPKTEDRNHRSHQNIRDESEEDANDFLRNNNTNTMRTKEGGLLNKDENINNRKKLKNGNTERHAHAMNGQDAAGINMNINGYNCADEYFRHQQYHYQHDALHSPSNTHMHHLPVLTPLPPSIPKQQTQVSSIPAQNDGGESRVYENNQNGFPSTLKGLLSNIRHPMTSTNTKMYPTAEASFSCNPAMEPSRYISKKDKFLPTRAETEHTACDGDQQQIENNITEEGYESFNLPDLIHP